MRLVHVDLLKPGQVVAKTIYSSEGFPLLKDGVVLEEKHINRLRLLGINYIYIEDDISKEIQVKDVVETEERIRLINLFKKFWNDLKTKINKKITPDELQLEEWEEIWKQEAKKLAVTLRGLANKTIELLDIRQRSDVTYNHPINVAIVAGAVGVQMALNEEHLEKLILGCFLHDIGIAFLKENELQEEKPLFYEPQTAYRQHPRIGYTILKKHQGIGILSAHVAYNHHERWDGKGYPRGISKDAIPLVGRITAVANEYDYLTGGTVNLPPIKAEEAVEGIIGLSGKIFDPKVIEAFVRVVAVYPKGITVRLSTGDLALVIENNKSLPLRPVVRPIRFKKGKPIPLSSLDLSVVRDVTIKEIVPGF